jgi:hypothetical protein
VGPFSTRALTIMTFHPSLSILRATFRALHLTCCISVCCKLLLDRHSGLILELRCPARSQSLLHFIDSAIPQHCLQIRSATFADGDRSNLLKAAWGETSLKGVPTTSSCSREILLVKGDTHHLPYVGLILDDCTLFL